MVNLDQICKVEVYGDFYRLYLVSGDVEEVDRKTFMSAVQTSGAQFMTFDEQPGPSVPFDELSSDDVEDVSDLSDGNLVDEAMLGVPTSSNACVEGASVIDPRDVLSSMSKEQLLKVLATLKAE